MVSGENPMAANSLKALISCLLEDTRCQMAKIVKGKGDNA
jgi:hypothetical protein